MIYRYTIKTENNTFNLDTNSELDFHEITQYLVDNDAGNFKTLDVRCEYVEEATS